MRPADDTGRLPAARPKSQEIAATADYAALRDAIVERASAARERAARAVNTELVLLYWSIGRAILIEQERHAWGDDVVGLLAQDLRARGGLGRGFSRRNLFYMRKFAALWPDEQIVQPLAAQIGWTHHQVLLDAFGEAPDLYAWYAANAIENRWSRRQLRGQIDLKLHLRTGAATANYAATLGDVDGRAALAVTRTHTSSTSSTSPRTPRSAISRTPSSARFLGSYASLASASPTTAVSNHLKSAAKSSS